MSSKVFERVKSRSQKPRFMPLEEFLAGCRENPGYYASAHERLLKAMGEPVIVDTKDQARLGRIHHNKKIRTFPTFADFYGIEPTIELLYDKLKAASQGLEESKQIIYFLGPVGSAKSSLAERLKELMEREKIYVLAVRKDPTKDEFDLSPLYESPLGLFPTTEATALENEYGVPSRYFTGICSPWAVKRLEEFEGDVTQFYVAEMYPSRLREIGISKTEPGDENNQDISSLVGKADVRMLEDFSINDPDAYAYSGSLCKASQGLMEFVEMFKAPIKTLHPLLTATQERNFMGTQQIGAMPFNGLIVAHSNETEWTKFSTDPANEAFLDRVCIIRVPYNLRLTDEVFIYEKLLRRSALADITVAPFSFELLGRTVIASRLKKSKTSPEHKVLIYDGRDLRNEVPNASTHYALAEEAAASDPPEGMSGISTRTAFKIISRAANVGDEIAIDPIELNVVLQAELRSAMGPNAKEHVEFMLSQLKGWLKNKVGDMIREALLEDYEEFAQSRFARYVEQADVWLNKDVGAYRDPDTGMMLDKDAIDKKLKEVEGKGIPNTKDFRQDIVNWVLRFKANHGNELPKWDDYEPMRKVIQALVVDHTKDLLPLISFGKKRDSELDEKHSKFLQRMQERGFTPMQVRRIVEWYNQENQAS